MSASKRAVEAPLEATPLVSFALFIRNEISTVEKCLDSLLGQTIADLELVISDNASDDGTLEILQRYERRDRRVRLFAQEKNIGLVNNVNFVINACRGRFVRLIGGHDWLEQDYAEVCLGAAQQVPKAVVVTTEFDISDEHGNIRSGQYKGARLESDNALVRLRKLLFFFHAGDAEYDPVYSLIRRDALLETGLIRMMASADWVLSVELSLSGPFAHVDRCLAHRIKFVGQYSQPEEVLKSYHPEKFQSLRTSAARLLFEFSRVLWSGDLSLIKKLLGQLSIVRFYCREVALRSWPVVRRSVGAVLRRFGLR